MVNYQLYRTNVLLGGQMKYDLILNSNAYGLSISDFHITPISNKAPYNKYIKDNLLNYTHKDNISRYYKNISSSFYKDFVSTELNNLYPIVSKNSKNYDDTYEMGCRRMQYNLYNKQFSYLCPLWIEQIKDDECLMFEIIMYTDKEQTVAFSTKKLYLDIFDMDTSDVKYHNNFINYFNDYLNYIGCKNGNDWVINIKEDVSEIIGLNVETGMNKLINSAFVYQNLISRERPLLEQNNILINELSNNKLIAKQIFNFNFCFNLQDLCEVTTSYQILNNHLKGKSLYIGVKTYICEKESKRIIQELEYRDFFSNHDYIKKFNCSPSHLNLKYVGNNITLDDTNEKNDFINPTEDMKELNVLNYLQDYNCIDLIDKNKIIQNTIHWSLIDNPEITFNFYNGFAGYMEGQKGNKIMLKYSNAYTPDTNDDIYKNYLNQYWCNSIILDENKIDNKGLYVNFAKELINLPMKYESLFSKFNNKCSVKNIRYECGEEQLIYEDESGKYTYDKNIYTIILINKLNDIIFDDYMIEDMNISYTAFNKKSGFYVIVDRKDISNIKRYIIFILNDDMQYLPLKKIKSVMGSLVKSTRSINFNDDFNMTINRFNEIINSPANNMHVYVTIPGSLEGVTAQSPSLSSTEFEYYKIDKNVFIERNIGKIKPTFIENNSENFFNFKFTKINIDEAKNIGDYFKYQNTCFPAKYPSINFYPFKKEIQKYDIVDNNMHEYNNFTFNKVYNLSADISTKLYSKKIDGKYVPVKQLIEDYIKELYQIQDDGIYRYILSLYEYTYSFEYMDDTWDFNEGPSYIYDIKIKLK